MTKLASSVSFPPDDERAAARELKAPGERERVRKRVAISLRRGLLRFVEVPPKGDADPWAERGFRTGSGPSSV